ncbi:MAG: hypothetical protein HY717_13465 [Planctomycetes bacterium]|nr:hypothetical protein [Planctomycetota bacterium]
MQETFLAALNGRSQFKGKSSEHTWLLSILRHKLIDQFRRTCRERPAEELGADDPETDGCFDSKGFWKERPDLWTPDPEALLEEREFWEVFQKCSSGLPVRLGATFSLRVMEGPRSPRIPVMYCASARPTSGYSEAPGFRGSTAGQEPSLRTPCHIA